MVKSTLIKRTAKRILTLHRNDFTEDYEKNKSKVTEFAELHSTKLRNSIAGLVTKLMKKDK